MLRSCHFRQAFVKIFTWDIPYQSFLKLRGPLTLTFLTFFLSCCIWQGRLFQCMLFHEQKCKGTHEWIKWTAMPKTYFWTIIVFVSIDQHVGDASLYIHILINCVHFQNTNKIEVLLRKTPVFSTNKIWGWQEGVHG